YHCPLQQILAPTGTGYVNLRLNSDDPNWDKCSDPMSRYLYFCSLWELSFVLCLSFSSSCSIFKSSRGMSSTCCCCLNSSSSLRRSSFHFGFFSGTFSKLLSLSFITFTSDSFF